MSLMFNIFPIIFLLFFGLFFAVFIFVIVSNVRRESHNNHSPASPSPPRWSASGTIVPTIAMVTPLPTTSPSR